MSLLTDKQISSAPLLSIFILSATALAYEVLLIRLLSIVHWHHFATMVISIALLGYGVSGSIISVFRKHLLENYNRYYLLNIFLFSVSAIICFIVVQLMPFNTLEILWDPTQWQRLFLSYLLLTLPFFFVANAIVLTLMRFHSRLAMVYGVDLIGAGIGALSVMLLLQFFSNELTMRMITVAGLMAALATIGKVESVRKTGLVGTLLVTLLLIILLPQQWLEIKSSEYKGLSQTLQVKDTVIRSSHSSSVSQIDVVRSPFIPFRHAPGLSLQSPAAPPEQLAVFRDGDEMTTIDHVTDRQSIEYLAYMTSALPYELHSTAQSALILRSATGTQILQSHYYGLEKIDAVEPDDQLSQLISDEFSDYYGWQNLENKVTIYDISARGYASSDKHYDIVILGPSGSSTGGAAGVHTMTVSYDYTVEALQSYLKLLEPDGLLAITQWTSSPARDNLKLFATAVNAMNNNGVKKPADNIAWLRSWNTATLMIKNSAYTHDDLNKIRAFAQSRNFDLSWLPGISASETNRYQLLQQDVFYQTATSVLGVDDQADTFNFIDRYKYDIHPVRDNRPFFYDNFKWSSIPEFIALPGNTGLSMIGVGYPTLLFTLLQAVVASVFLILLPLLFIRPVKNRDYADGSNVTDTGVTRDNSAVAKRRNIIIYFLSIGLAFLFIEIAFIQKFILILSQPLYAVAVTLCAFLIFSGIGSIFVQRYLLNNAKLSIPGILKYIVLAIALISVIYIIALPSLSNSIMALPEAARIFSAFIIAAPLAFAMGMPFPLGVAALQRVSPEFVPWAWGINGCASVLSAILAALLAIETGFNGVMYFAIALYLIAWKHIKYDAQ